MKKISAILISIMLCVVTLLFSGCGSVRSMTMTNADGTIDELVYIELDEEQVKAADYNIKELELDISLTGERIAQGYVDTFVREMSKKSGEAKTEEKQIFYNRAASGIKIIKSQWQENTGVLGIKFLNNDVYKLFYGITDENTNEPLEEKHLFYSKISYVGHSKYIAYSSLYDELKIYYEAKYPNLIKEDSGELLYTFVTNYRRERSNADYVTKMDGQYYHTWVIDSLDEEIVIYYNTLNRGNMIIAVVIFSLIVCAILNLIVFVKKKKAKATNVENE